MKVTGINVYFNTKQNFVGYSIRKPLMEAEEELLKLFDSYCFERNLLK